MSMTTSSVAQVESFFSATTSFSRIDLIILVASTGRGKVNFSGKVLLPFPPLRRRSMITRLWTSPDSLTFTIRPRRLTVPPLRRSLFFLPIQLPHVVQLVVPLNLNLGIADRLLEAHIVLDVFLQGSIRIPSANVDLLLLVHRREDPTRLNWDLYAQWGSFN